MTKITIVLEDDENNDASVTVAFDPQERLEAKPETFAEKMTAYVLSTLDQIASAPAVPVTVPVSPIANEETQS